MHKTGIKDIILEPRRAFTYTIHRKLNRKYVSNIYKLLQKLQLVLCREIVCNIHCLTYNMQYLTLCQALAPITKMTQTNFNINRSYLYIFDISDGIKQYEYVSNRTTELKIQVPQRYERI